MLWKRIERVGSFFVSFVFAPSDLTPSCARIFRSTFKALRSYVSRDKTEIYNCSIAALQRFTFDMSRGPGRTFLYQLSVLVFGVGCWWCLLLFVIVAGVPLQRFSALLLKMAPLGLNDW